MPDTKEFNEAIENTGRVAVDCLNVGQVIILEHLLEEIRMNNYTTISDINGAIHNHLDRLKGKA